MKNVRIYQSSKYRSNRYKLVNFIYFLDRKDNSYCLPLMGYLEPLDKYRDIINGLCNKFEVMSHYAEEIQIGETKILLFELRGTLDNLVGASDIIGNSIIPIYVQNSFVDLYIDKEEE